MQRVRDAMTPNPVFCQIDDTVADAALKMAEFEIGDVLVMDGSDLFGIVTDRDIVVRCIAAGQHPRKTELRGIASMELEVVGPDDSLHDAVVHMRKRKIRRVPVQQGGELVGVLSIGDLAIELDADSALAEISRAPATL